MEIPSIKFKEEIIYVQISVKERLPQKAAWYLCCYNNDIIQSVYYSKSTQSFDHPQPITHWLEKQRRVVYTLKEIKDLLHYN